MRPSSASAFGYQSGAPPIQLLESSASLRSALRVCAPADSQCQFTLRLGPIAAFRALFADYKALSATKIQLCASFPKLRVRTPVRITRFPKLRVRTPVRITRFPKLRVRTPVRSAHCPKLPARTPVCIARFPKLRARTPVRSVSGPCSNSPHETQIFHH
jgi:hypothetical protein